MLVRLFTFVQMRMFVYRCTYPWSCMYDVSMHAYDVYMYVWDVYVYAHDAHVCVCRLIPVVAGHAHACTQFAYTFVFKDAHTL